MSPLDALSFLDSLTAQLQVNRNTHAQAIQAVSIIRTALTPVPIMPPAPPVAPPSE